jgi:NAD(P)-dependent dehydrogenase (short-subunit alcohol dehydrogenase family)
MLNIDLSGKKALVSGVCRGIGLGIARQLARAGCDVAGCGLSKANQPGPRAFLKAVASENHRGVYQAVDITLKHGPQQWVDQASRAIGGVDILVSNAGRNFFSGVENCDDKTWKKCIDRTPVAGQGSQTLSTKISASGHHHNHFKSCVANHCRLFSLQRRQSGTGGDGAVTCYRIRAAYPHSGHRARLY